MRFNALAVVMVCGVVCTSVYAYPPSYSDEPFAVSSSGDSDDDGGGGGYAMPQLNIGYGQLHHQHQENNKPPSGTYTATMKTTLTSEAVAETISATKTTAARPSLQPAFVYSAQVPAHMEPEANKVVNAVKLASSTVAAAEYPSLPSSPSSSYQTGDYTNAYQSSYFNDNVEKDGEFPKKPIGSSAASSVSVILNGDQPEFTDALGQKVPKPQPSLQVASPIDLLNPDRYEFYTFDEHGELVKRLMTMEEIQSIVANGDGDGPTIIHHGPAEDRNPEKNVQDIVNSVQDVLNKEVESNKNQTSNILPVLDTPDVSSSWSMILPAIFGNTGGLDIFPQQKPQQVVMIPDTEIIETSTAAPVTTTTSKPKQNKRKPGQKRKPSSTTTTTEMTPQVIQEELDSHESVYTGMQQYQHLTSSMNNYDSFSQMHMQPIYHKLPEQLSVETTTKRVISDNQKVAEKPSVDEMDLNGDLAKKPPSVQHKPSSPHRVKKPSSGQTTTKRPQSTKQKIKRKPTTTTTLAPETTTIAEAISTTPQPTTTTTQATTTAPTTTTTTTTESVVTTTTTTTTTESAPALVPIITVSTPVTEIPMPITSAAPKKKKKKPTRHPIHSSSTATEKRKPSTKPHKTRPTQQTTTPSDLSAEGSVHQEVSQNNYQHVSYHRPRPKPQKTTTTPKPTTTSVPSTTVIFSPVPVATVATPQESSLIVEEFPGYQPIKLSTTTSVTTEMTKLQTTSTSAPSGTAGYPIPAYGLAADVYEESNTNQYKKQPLHTLAMIQQVGSKPYDQDIHTMQSFDQIMQSLKQPELQLADTHTTHTSHVKPVQYDSAENMDQLEEMANKHMMPVTNSMIGSPTTTTPPATLVDIETTNAPSLSSSYSEEATVAADESASGVAMPTGPQYSLAYDEPQDVTTNVPIVVEIKEIETTYPVPLETVTEPTVSITETKEAEATNSTPLENITEPTVSIIETTTSTSTVSITETKEIETTTAPPFEKVTESTVSITETKEMEATNSTPLDNIAEPTVSIETTKSTPNEKITTQTETTEQISEEYTITQISPETTEGPHVKQDTSYVQEAQTELPETTAETPINLPPLTYGETTTDSAEMPEEITVQGQYRLPVAAPQKEHTAFMDDDKEAYTQTILVADLKPQLNMEVIKPSSQISMSEFQTQAATVASTLVDGSNTIGVDYNLMSSNETKDEIAFLMSDVIKQMSYDEQSTTKPEIPTYISSHHYSNDHQIESTQANYNDNLQSNGGHGFYSPDQTNNNRYSNLATLNTSFLMPAHDEVIMQPDLLDSYGNAEEDEETNQKPSYERLEDSSVMNVVNASGNEEYAAAVQEEAATTSNNEMSASMTPFDYITQLPPDSMKVEDATNSNEVLSSLDDISSTTTKSEQESQQPEYATENSLQLNNESTDRSGEMSSEESDGDNNTSTESEEEDSTTPIIFVPIEADEESTTFEVPVPSLSQVYADQQKLQDIDDREALFEADSSVDTTTQINNLSEEATEQTTRWETSTEENKMPQTSEPTLNATTLVIANDEHVTEISLNESKEQQPDETLATNDDSSEDVEEVTTSKSTQSAEDDKMDISAMETATIKVDSNEGLGEVSNSEDVTQAITAATISGEGSAVNTAEHSAQDNESGYFKLEHIAQETTTVKDDGDSEEVASTESEETGYPEITTHVPLLTEDITAKVDLQHLLADNEDTASTTLNYQMSEETSEELTAMISEEDETDELVDEDPYIKLGETTTTKSVESTTTLNSPIELQSAESETQYVNNIEKVTSSAQYGTDESENPSINQGEKETKNEESPKPSTEGYGFMLAPPKPISDVVENNIPTGTHTVLPPANDEETFEGADEEDEDDQHGYEAPKLPTTTTLSSTTTTPKPTTSTTRRLNTLKPVSYFNKQPAYALYQDPVEPLFNKQPSYPPPQQLQENVPNKFMTYSVQTPQQRPMQRPPQLSNLMIGSNQATRPPVKLEPSPNSSKGLEASLANLDEDILAFARLCNELAFSYWKSITSEKISSARSLVISPFALTSMLSMVFLGARGSTSGEMNDILKLDDMVTFNPHLVFKNITDSVEKAMDSDIATTAFVREVFSDRANGKILQFFKEKTQQLYAGHVEEVNFHVVNDIIRRRTNLLVKRHTMGKVLEYLRTNSVWVNGPLATISANLFQTDCSHGSTLDRDGELFFQVHPTVRQRRLVPIPAVLFKSGFTAGYEPTLEATVVAFGRIQDTVSMIYVMPGHQSSISPSDNLDRLEKELMETAISKNAWSNMLTSLMDRPGMEVQLPRFSHRSFVNATLGLQKMGLKGLFKSDYADLGGLTGSSNRDIYLSDMIQINTFSTCGEEKIADHHHVEMYPAPPLRKRNKDVDAHDDDDFDSSEAVIDFGSLVHESALGRGFYDDLLDPKYLELPLPLRPRQARVPDAPRLRFDKPFLYFVRHNPTGMILFMGRFNPRLLP